MDLAVLLHCTLFLLTGVVSTVGNQFLVYLGAADRWTLLLCAPTYLGMAAVGLLPGSLPNFRFFVQRRNLRIFFVGMLDLLSFAVCAAGMSLAGSGLYQILYSAVIVFTALLVRCVFGRSLSMQQWGAVLVIVGGLAASVDLGQVRSSDGSDVPLGAGLTLFGTFMYGVLYTVNEYFLTAADAPTPNQYSMLVGVYASAVVFSWMAVYTYPRWHDLVRVPVDLEGGRWGSIVVLLVLLTLSSFGHSVSWFYLIKHTGGVAVGILQALRAAAVFFFSSILFCENHTAQCITSHKVTSAGFVVAGVVAFTLAPKMATPAGGIAESGGKFEMVPSSPKMEVPVVLE